MKAKVVADSKYNHLGFVPLKEPPPPFLRDFGEVKFHSLTAAQCKIAFNHIDIQTLWQ